MRPKNFFKKIFLASFVLFALAFSLMAPAFAEDCQPGVTPLPCPSGAEFCRPCDPPSLPHLEVIAVEALGFVWVMTGIIFFGLFVYNSYLYMFNKVEDSKKRMVQWVIGLIMILFAQPLIATVMETIIDKNTQCFEELRQPTFTFFFPTVCETN